MYKKFDRWKTETFQMNVLTPPSGSKTKEIKQNFLRNSYLFGFPFNCEDGGSVFFRNVVGLQNYTPSCLTKYHLLWMKYCHKGAFRWNTFFIYFFIYNLNQQSEFTFSKLMLWLLQCRDGESSSGESPVPQIRSIGQFLLSHLFSSLDSSVSRSGFSWVPSVMFVAFLVDDLMYVWYA
jgi:hypothetical protein